MNCVTPDSRTRETPSGVAWLAAFALSATLLNLAACGGSADSGGTIRQEDTLTLVDLPQPSPTAGPSTTAVVPSSAASACDNANGRVLSVGPGQIYTVPSAAAAVAQSGDVIRISAGDYHGDVATWTASNLTICGAGGRARLFADGRSAQGKAIWVVSGSNITIDGIEFHDAKVPDQNGAGIRAEHGGNLGIRNSGFFDNENGILGGSGSATVTIERSEFARNGYGDGQSHNLYIGDVAKLTVNASFFHEAKIGHNLKSRARETVIENSYFMDGPEGTSSYLAEFPNGGAVYLRGNLFQKGPNADNSIAISHGAEGLKWSVNTLDLVHNTVVMTRSGGAFLATPAETQSVRLTANLFAGTGTPALITGGFPGSSIIQASNFAASALSIPGADDIEAPRFWAAAGLLDTIRLTNAPDPSYTVDAPRPFALRAVSGSTRMIGALQAPP
jgi:hypothetical protein